MTTPTRPSDSAGVPFHARVLTATGFDGDSGAVDDRLLAVLVGTTDDTELVAAVAAARWLVPVVAAPTETVQGPHGPTADARVDLAAVTLTSPTGERALPVFSSLASMADWDAAARPVPVTAARAAQAAVAEGCDVVVLDLGAPHTRTLRPSMVWALAQQRAWLPPHADPFVAASVRRAVEGDMQVTASEVAEGEPAGQGVLAVRLTLVPGLPAQGVRDLVTAVGERLATDGEFRARVDALVFTIASAQDGDFGAPDPPC